MKLAVDEKVTLYSYSVGSIVFLNDPVKNVGCSGKLGRVWFGPYQVTWLSSHSCRLVHTRTGKVIQNLVHINRIKPYFYRDELPDDPDDISSEVMEELSKASELVETGPEVGRVTKAKQTKGGATTWWSWVCSKGNSGCRSRGGCARVGW